MKTLKEILAKKPLHFNFVNPDAKVIDAISLMKIEDISYVIVMEGHNFLGILSEKDYTQKVILQNKNSSNTKVKDIMTKDFPVVTIEESIDKCMELMNTFKVPYLPMFDGHSFKGVITINDLLAASIDEKRASQNDANFLKDNSNDPNTIQHYWI